MTPKFKLALASLALAASGIASSQTLLNGSYDVAREFYRDYNAAFVAHYKKATGKDVKVDQSYAGSSAVARSVADGLDADVVTMNTSTDVEFLANAGAVIGGIAGSSVGHKRANIAVGVLGAVLGGVAGNAIEKGTTGENAVEMVVQLTNGSRIAIVQAAGSQGFRPGDRVNLIGQPGAYRVTRNNG